MAHVKQVGLGFVAGALVGVLVMVVLSGSTNLQKGSLAPGAVQGAGFDPICSSLSVTQCEQSPQCQVFRVPNFDYQYCVRTGVTCTYTSPNVDVLNLNVTPGNNSSNPFDPTGRVPMTISYQLNTAAVVNVGVYRSGQLVKQVASNYQTLGGGNYSHQWNGADTNGDTVMQGSYEVRVTARGASNQERTATAGVVIVPTTTVLRGVRVDPATFDPSRVQTTRLYFTVNRAVGGRVFVTPSGSNRPVAYLNSSAGSNFQPGENSYTWDGKNTSGAIVANGTYQINIDASGVSGTASVTVARVQTQIGNYYVYPDTFDAEAGEVTRVKFTPNVDVVALVKIKDQNGAVINDITNNRWTLFRANQEASVTWDGTRQNSTQKVPPGRYNYTIEAVAQQVYLNNRSAYTDDSGNARATIGSGASIEARQNGNVVVAAACRSITLSRTDLSDSRATMFRFTANVTPSTFTGAINWSASGPSYTILYPVSLPGQTCPQTGGAGCDTKVVNVRVQNNAPRPATITASSGSCRATVDMYTGQAPSASPPPGAPQPSPPPPPTYEFRNDAWRQFKIGR